MLAILHLLAMFVADLFKPRRLSFPKIIWRGFAPGGNQGNILCDACHSHLLAMFVVDLFKPRRQLEVENLLCGISSTSLSLLKNIILGETVHH